MTNEPKDGLDTHLQASEAIYDRNAATPLPTRPGEMHASFSVQHAQKRLAEVYEQTGQRPDPERYRSFDDLPPRAAQYLIDGDLDNMLATARVSEDPEGDELALARRIEADSQESRSRIIARYGLKQGVELLERTQRWARTQPALAHILQQRGLGSRPELVEALVAHVFSNGIR